VRMTTTRHREVPTDDDVTAKTRAGAVKPRAGSRAPLRAKVPQDHMPPGTAQRREAMNTEQTFTWDGQEWTITPADATGLEFLAALEDDEIIAAVRLLLGRDQATRLFKGRRVEDLEGFFEALGEVVDSGNP